MCKPSRLIRFFYHLNECFVPFFDTNSSNFVDLQIISHQIKHTVILFTEESILFMCKKYQFSGPNKYNFNLATYLLSMTLISHNFQ